MSVQLISQYHHTVEKIIHYGGNTKETAVRNAYFFYQFRQLRSIVNVFISKPLSQDLTCLLIDS